MSRASDAARGEAAEGDGELSGFGIFNHRKHQALRAEIEGFLRPHSGDLREAEDGGSGGGGEGSEAVEGVGDASRAVLHVDHHVVVAGQAGYFGEGGGGAEEEEAVKDSAGSEVRFEGSGFGEEGEGAGGVLKGEGEESSTGTRDGEGFGVSAIGIGEGDERSDSGAHGIGGNEWKFCWGCH